MNGIVARVLAEHGVDAAGFRPWQFQENVWSGTVPEAPVMKIWWALRGHFHETGVWPVYRGDVDDTSARPAVDVASTLNRVPAGGVPALLAERLEERVEACREALGDDPPILGVERSLTLREFAERVDASTLAGPGASQAEAWPTSKEEQAVRPFKGYVKRARMALIALKHPYEAPAYLGFGGWNDAPMPELQVAMLREWERRYGAAPLSIMEDVLECYVERPPETEAEAMELAAEQWIFCDDIVSQGTQTVRELGMEIWRSRKWFFWWD